MKKYLSLLVLSAALFGAGCSNRKQNKAVIEQKETVIKELLEEEQAPQHYKEDYTIIS